MRALMGYAGVLHSQSLELNTYISQKTGIIDINCSLANMIAKDRSNIIYN